ncbi:uncharacterized protein LOC143857861 isoform X2 [Tasmannia lanceolata]|uniref:uncharacterized protein LOC143857861 isoform X2 n=1 Tax=Tasmannia lanceolata TaxID=3420 RepID=UPI00406304A7
MWGQQDGWSDLTKDSFALCCVFIEHGAGKKILKHELGCAPENNLAAHVNIPQPDHQVESPNGFISAGADDAVLGEQMDHENLEGDFMELDDMLSPLPDING